MFAGINICVFETKLSSWGLIFVARSSLVNYLGTLIYVCVYMYLCLQFEDDGEFPQINPSQTLMNLQYV